MSIGRLIVEFEARTGKFETDTGRAAKIMEKRAREIEKQTQRIASAFGAAIGVGVAGAIVGLAALTKKAINAADEFNKLSQKTGLSTEALSALDFAAKQSGVEDLGTSLIKLNKAINEAGQGSKSQAAAFDAIGVSVADAEGKLRGTEEVLRDIANAFARYADGPAKTALALDLFGKSGADLIPLLNGGAAGLDAFTKRATELGLIIDTKTAKASEAFNDDLGELKLGLEGVGRSVARELAPKLLDLSKIVADPAFTAGLKSIAETAIAATESVAKLVARIGAASENRGLEKLTREAEFLRQTIERRSNGKGFLEVFGRDVDTELAGLSQRLAVVNAEIARLADSKIDAALLAEAEALERAGTAATNAAPPILNYAGAADRAGNSARRAAKAVDEWAASTQSKAAIDEEAARLLGPLESQAASVFESTRTPVEQFKKQIADLERLRDLKYIDTETFTRAVDNATQDLERLTSGFEKVGKTSYDTFEDMSTFADQAARNMQDAFADFLFDPFENGLKGMLRSFADTLQRMAAEAAAAQIFEGLKSGGTGGAFDFFGDLFSIGGSGLDIPISSGTMDSGGRGAPGRAYAIGVGAQPELFIPDTAGTFVPRDQWEGKGGMQVTQNFHFPSAGAAAAPATQQQVATSAARGLRMAERRNG